MKLIINGLAVNYRRTGQGKPVLLLHGWKSDLSTFEDLTRELSDKFSVTAVDLPGFGQSEPPSADWNLDDYINFVAEFLKKAGITNLYALICHSLGARIALKGVGTRKLQSQKLVLLGAHGIRESKSIRNRLFWLAAKTGKLATKPLPAKVRSKLQRGLYRRAGSSDYIEAGSLKQTFTNIINEDVRPEAAMIDIPTLLIYGKEDTITPVSFGGQFKQLIKGSRLEVVNGAGHYVHIDNPPLTNKLVMDFLR